VAPPEAPTGLTASAVAGPVVNLSWTDNATNETGFLIERSVNGGAYAQLSTPGPFAGTGTVTATDNTVTVGNTYSYRVYAVGAGGQSAPSNVATVLVPLPTPPPAAPNNLTAVLQTGPTGAVIRLTFRDNATNETGFQLWQSVNGGAFALRATLPLRAGTGNVTYNDQVPAGNTYAYYVIATGASANSAPSNTATLTVPPPPAAPSNFNGTAIVTGGGTTARVTLTWVDNANNETSFQIQRSTSADFTANLVSNTAVVNATTFTVNNLPRGTAYYFRIRAINLYGQSVWVNLNQFPITTP
jgi:predicted phage tail protein